MNIQSIYTIYGISSSRNPEEIRYIGITRNMYRRKISHRCYKNVKPNRKVNWVKNVLESGYELVFTEIENELSESDALKKEVDYIKLFRAMGARVVNGTVGGGGVRQFFVSAETRKKQSEAKIRNPNLYWLGKKRPEVATWSKGRPIGYRLSEEAKEKLSKSHMGIKHSEETRAKLSKAFRGKARESSRIPISVMDLVTGDSKIVYGWAALRDFTKCGKGSFNAYIRRQSKAPFLRRFLVYKV